MKRRTKGLLLFTLIVVILLGGRLVAGLLLQEAPHVLTPEEEVLQSRALETKQKVEVCGSQDSS